MTIAVVGDQQASLSLLQGFELRIGSRVVVLTPTSQRLVAFVALHERPVRRNYVSGVLWPDVTEERAGANLRSALWRVPDVDGEPLVAASSTHLQLRSGLEVDFHQALARSQRLLQAAPSGSLGESLEVLCNDLLPDWYEDWVILERERYRQLRLHALDRACQQLIDARRYTEALQLALKAVAAEPLRESTHRHLVRIHLAEGNLAEAVRQYQRYADMLHTELGAHPSEAMRALFAGKVPAPPSPAWSPRMKGASSSARPPSAPPISRRVPGSW